MSVRLGLPRSTVRVLSAFSTFFASRTVGHCRLCSAFEWPRLWASWVVVHQVNERPFSHALHRESLAAISSDVLEGFESAAIG